jgi:hypothetical protein
MPRSRLPGLLSGQAGGRELPQFVVHDRQQVVGRPAVAGGRGFEQTGDVRHLPESTGRRPTQHGQSATIEAHDDVAQRLVVEKWQEPDLQLQIVRQDSDRL